MLSESSVSTENNHVSIARGSGDAMQNTFLSFIVSFSLFYMLHCTYRFGIGKPVQGMWSQNRTGQ